MMWQITLFPIEFFSRVEPGPVFALPIITMSLFDMDLSFLEIVARAFIIYISLYIMLRLSGRKQLGEMSPFDLILLLIISESVSNGLTGDDNSIPAGVVSAGSLILLSYIMDRLTFSSKRFEKLMEGEAKLVIVDGKVRKDILNKEKISDDELKETMRAHGIGDLNEIRYAVLESNGKISFIRKQTGKDSEQNNNSESSTIQGLL